MKTKIPFGTRVRRTDPRDPRRVLIGTESDGVHRSEDGGVTETESNDGLAEARLSSVAVTGDGTVVVARAADGPSGGLWSVDAASGEARRFANSPPATVLALAASGARLLAGTPDGLFLADRSGGPWTKVLSRGTREFAGDGEGRLLAATDAGVFETRDGGRRWVRLGTLAAPVEAVRRTRLGGMRVTTFSADSEGTTLFWNGRDWSRRAAAGARVLTGGFGRPRIPLAQPEPLGLTVDTARSLLFFHPEPEGEDSVAIALPESGLAVAGWAGDPRTPSGLYLATVGRGLFRYVPAGL